jgi:hypothetical protein
MADCILIERGFLRVSGHVNILHGKLKVLVVLVVLVGNQQGLGTVSGLN